MSETVIYDFGANNGDDIPYYLSRAAKVVAVEANTSLCREIEDRFPAEIRSGRLFIENCVLASDNKGDVSFYIHKDNHVLSQFPEPEDKSGFTEIRLRSRTPSEIVEQYGPPLYVKIDVEHYDQVILKSLFDAGIRPPFISAESHSIEIFALLVAAGRYNSFKLIDGQTVSTKYKNHPHHSAGPFGNDVNGEWMTAENFFQYLAHEGLGWKDIHATNVIEPNISAKAGLLTYARLSLRNLARGTSSLIYSVLAVLRRAAANPIRSVGDGHP